MSLVKYYPAKTVELWAEGHPGVVIGEEDAIYLATEMGAMLNDAKDVAILLRAHLALKTYPKFLVDDPDYKKATHLLEKLGVQP